MNIERRIVSLDRIEVRQGPDGGPMLSGHAAVFDKFSLPMWDFVEVIRHGTFARALREGQDVRSLVDHISHLVLGRTTATPPTLTLMEDATGLAFDNPLPDTSYARDLAISVKRGDITQASFAFRDKEWTFVEGGGPEGEDLRELRDVDLFDVSPVTYAAYPDTDVAMRAHGPDEEARAAYELWKAERRGVQDVQAMAALAPLQARQARAEATIL